ncbi:MAG: ATP-binding cassette domain-containing protein [Coriobacteriia bacterium]|nr:ATP-binding cassette domain-containing protein [Coriobacteriia bacterium]MCL2870081.1 ATP-binding cassette domain-containing protein [Coriobacteriia bacterium]
MKNLFTLEEVAFEDVTFPPLLEIKKGEVTFICGKSGHGKSTLLKLLNNMISADSGKVLYLGNSIENYNPVQLRQEVLFCRQATYLFEGTIYENFNQFYRYRELPPPSKKEIRHYLDICAIEFDLDADCNLMSGGERHRIYLAICLSFQPKVLLLDEPTSALDDATAHEALKGIIHHCEEHSIDLIVVSHNTTLTDTFAHAVIRLENKSCSNQSIAYSVDADTHARLEGNKP